MNQTEQSHFLRDDMSDQSNAVLNVAVQRLYKVIYRLHIHDHQTVVYTPSMRTSRFNTT